MNRVSATDEWRQGDIFDKVQFPLWHVHDFDVVHDKDGKKPRLIVGSSLDVPVIMCSHDCDIENSDRRAGLLVAPLVEPPGDPGTEQWQMVMDSALPRSDEEYEYVHLYPFDIPGIGVRVADFSRLTTILSPKRLKGVMKAMRMFQLSDEERATFQAKLIAFFSRSNAPRSGTGS